MDTYSVTMQVYDCMSCNCCKNVKDTTAILVNQNSFIQIQNGYSLQILGVNANNVLFSITNGITYIIRFAYLDIPLYICIENDCCEHLLNILVKNITV